MDVRLKTWSRHPTKPEKQLKTKKRAKGRENSQEGAPAHHAFSTPDLTRPLLAPGHHSMTMQSNVDQLGPASQLEPSKDVGKHPGLLQRSQPQSSVSSGLKML